MKENMKKTLSTTQSTPNPSLVNIKETIPLVNKPMKTMITKSKGTRKGLVEQDMGYDIIEDIKKKKETISLFELCNFPQQRKKNSRSF